LMCLCLYLPKEVKELEFSSSEEFEKFSYYGVDFFSWGYI
jgi:hypothetical protein